LDPFLIVNPNFFSKEIEIKGKQILIPNVFPDENFTAFFTVIS